MAHLCIEGKLYQLISVDEACKLVSKMSVEHLMTKTIVLKPKYSPESLEILTYPLTHFFDSYYKFSDLYEQRNGPRCVQVFGTKDDFKDYIISTTEKAMNSRIQKDGAHRFLIYKPLFQWDDAKDCREFCETLLESNVIHGDF